MGQAHRASGQRVRPRKMGQGSQGAVFSIHKMTTFEPSMWLYRRITACESPWEADVGPQLEHWEQKSSVAEKARCPPGRRATGRFPAMETGWR